VNIEFLYRSYDEREVLMQLALASGPSISAECREARSKALSARYFPQLVHHYLKAITTHSQLQLVFCIVVEQVSICDCGCHQCTYFSKKEPNKSKLEPSITRMVVVCNLNPLQSLYWEL
jgi:hypothetical protein